MPRGRKSSIETNKDLVEHQGGGAMTTFEQEMAQEISTFSKRKSGGGGNVVKIGQRKPVFIHPEYGESQAPLAFIVIDFVQRNAYYPREDAFDPDNPVAPRCWATGIEPDLLVPNNPMVPDQQNDTCAKCEHNKFPPRGTKGPRSKACKNITRFAIMTPDANPEDGEIMIIEASPTAQPSVAGYLNTCEAKKCHPVMFRTIMDVVESGGASGNSLRLKLDTDSPVENARDFWTRREEARMMLMSEGNYEFLISREEDDAPPARAPRKKAASRRRTR